MNINISGSLEETGATENTLLDDRYNQDMLTLVICCLYARTYFGSHLPELMSITYFTKLASMITQILWSNSQGKRKTFTESVRACDPELRKSPRLLLLYQ